MVSDRPKLLLLLTLSLLAGMSACLGKKSVRESLSIDRTSPALDDPSKPVLLNEALTIYFSEPILPTSVTSDSVSLIDESGHKVSGQLRAGKAGNDWVQFVPDPPLAAVGAEEGRASPYAEADDAGVDGGKGASALAEECED